jgi:hypothetical protein
MHSTGHDQNDDGGVRPKQKLLRTNSFIFRSNVALIILEGMLYSLYFGTNFVRMLMEFSVPGLLVFLWGASPIVILSFIVLKMNRSLIFQSFCLASACFIAVLLYIEINGVFYSKDAQGSLLLVFIPLFMNMAIATTTFIAMAIYKYLRS